VPGKEFSSRQDLLQCPQRQIRERTGLADRQNRKAMFEEEAQARAGNTGMSRYGQQMVCPYSGVIVNKARHRAGGRCHCTPARACLQHASMGCPPSTRAGGQKPRRLKRLANCTAHCAADCAHAQTSHVPCVEVTRLAQSRRRRAASGTTRAGATTGMPAPMPLPRSIVTASQASVRHAPTCGAMVHHAQPSWVWEAPRGAALVMPLL